MEELHKGVRIRHREVYMPYSEAKVYFDGSHYIAIPHTTREVRKSVKPLEEEILVDEEGNAFSINEDALPAFSSELDDVVNELLGYDEKEEKLRKVKSKTIRKELFERLYKENINLKRKDRREAIIAGMRNCFRSEQALIDYVDTNLERKHRNIISRRVRLSRKANLQEFNYFVTFTYDDRLHTEDSFRKDLRVKLNNLSCRKGWRYIGVWERSSEKKRLHFHGIFYIPEGTLPSMLVEKRDYSFNTHKMQVIQECTYFTCTFGRNDFEEICDRSKMGEALIYLMKYIEKSGEKIVYSKGLAQYFISDIMDEDVVCTIGQEDKKLLLFDDFECWDEGCLVGKVSKDTIKDMRKSN